MASWVFSFVESDRNVKLGSRIFNLCKRMYAAYYDIVDLSDLSIE